MAGPAGLTEEDVERHADILANRVRKNLKKLRPKFERDDIGVFRLYDWDIPEVRAVIDWYEGHLVVAEYAREQTKTVPDWIGRMGRAVAAKLEIAPGRIHLKQRRTQPAKGARYEDKGGRTKKRLEVRERDLRFLVNLDDYVDTGLFGDHRLLRQRIREEAKNKVVLNLFGYTGSFTCYAAAGGAKHTTTVDLSGPYLGWAKDNLVLNDLLSKRHDLVKADVLDWLESAREGSRRYEIAIVDPPSYSTRGGTGRAKFEVGRDHAELLARTVAVMRKKGVVYFSTNHQRFQPNFDRLKVKKIEEITDDTVPVDYRRRVHRTFRIEV